MKVQSSVMTPQAILKARFGELAESLGIDLIVRRQTVKFLLHRVRQLEKDRPVHAREFPSGVDDVVRGR